MELVLSDLWRLLAAIAAGALVGLERELADKPAGFRTNVLVCLGAALFTLISVRLADSAVVTESAFRPDRTRIAAQIVTGVGFLGAGAIIRKRGSVVGLTTAATIWAVASVGMAFGAGEWVVGFLGTVLTTVVLMCLGIVEARIAALRSVSRFVLEFEGPHENATATLDRLLRTHNVRRRAWRAYKRNRGIRGRLVARGRPEALDALEMGFLAEPTIRAVKRA